MHDIIPGVIVTLLQQLQAKKIQAEAAS